ncbi:alpha-L-rhamnosidase C-terminal domain-containing protein [Draconibacterium sp. IB214405]|uniref:alpha-L-rhamnosidase-related protein n=1 Tax=Draconibacterium sp. IB214405 TaxID=3097352 RepID=UPI002A124D29|nr:alpha-L-rhamnosidase C-terminal domain-containing protein [Draconibacterium sp. IB214405]MDX8341155.1 alpha-L-rhamnosidase C-terminal domain-containing protein [Draconibacterium sp. IB214405]
MKKQSIILSLLLVLCFSGMAQLPPVFKNQDPDKVRSSSLIRKNLTPERIVWSSDTTGNYILNAESLLKPSSGQADLSFGEFFTIQNDEETQHGIILDFGREIQGGIEIVTTRGNTSPAGKVRIRFGESVAETMCDVGENGATNDHAMRDFEVTLPTMGRLEVGESGFRFVRIDLVGPNAKILIKEISASFRYRDIPYLGSFICNDEELNNIWMTGAYTVHLNMNEYLLDGIKRDRLVWAGDMHPEMMTINSVFGYNDVVPKSLDFARDQYPLPNWMNDISSYSMWWILLQQEWYKSQGDFEYLAKQEEYLVGILNQLAKYIDEDGKETLDGMRFLDWPSSENEAAIHAGLQSMMVMSFEAGAELCSLLDIPETREMCLQSIEKLKKHIPDMAGSKQAAALLAMSGLISPEKANSEVLAKDGVHKMSTFYGYYMLIARAMAGDYQGAIDNIREYWGAMLDLGATTFWEDFDISWMENAARIDELVPEGKVNVHATYGGYCYEGYRHSFCHGWASGPTAWLTQYVLGINVVETGCKTIKISPHLGDLEWVKGTYPTPMGILTVEHKKMPDGSVQTKYTEPDGVKIILE